MKVGAIRVRAIYRKELREYRRTPTIVVTTAIIPLGIVIFPLLYVLALPASMAGRSATGSAGCPAGQYRPS